LEHYLHFMKLHLLRHARASQNSNGLDIDRSLNNKGLAQVSALREFIKGRLHSPVVWCSEANRTRMTLEGIKDVILPFSIAYKADFYLCNKDVILEQLWNNSPESELLIVGHNFGISDLLNYFTGEDITLGTCEYVCLDFDQLKLSESSHKTGVIITQFRSEI